MVLSEFLGKVIIIKYLFILNLLIYTHDNDIWCILQVGPKFRRLEVWNVHKNSEFFPQNRGCEEKPTEILRYINSLFSNVRTQVDTLKLKLKLNKGKVELSASPKESAGNPSILDVLDFLIIRHLELSTLEFWWSDFYLNPFFWNKCFLE